MSEVICLSSSDDELDPQEKRNQLKKSKQADEPIENVQLKKRKASVYVGFHPLSKRSRTNITPKVEKDVPPTSKDNGIEVLKVVSESEKSQKSKDPPEDPPKNASKKGAEPMEEAWNRPSTSQQSMKPPEVPPNSQKTQSNKSPKHSDAPQLVIREKRPVVDNHQGAEVFAQFLSQCLSRERSPQMEKILEKLKRIYDQLDQDYVRSSAFIDLLNDKRNLLLNDVRLYLHISDVVNEMKSRRRIAPVPKPKLSSEASKEAPEEPEKVLEVDEIDEKTDSRLRKILKVMEKCQKRIKQLEDAELDWDDEENSHYIQVSRYKERMMQLYYKYCELTGEHEDAGRLYLRPKYLKVTQIESVDQAIVSFINKRLTEKVKKTKKGKSAADCIVFPDYVDMLNCIKKCNSEQKLGMSKRDTEQLAKKAFKELGEHLKKARQKDFLDTFSLLDIGGEDPASKDPVIAAKLRESSIEGKRRMDELLEEFVRRQKEGPVDADEANGKKNGREGKEGDGDDEEDGESKKSEDSEKSEDDEEDSETNDNDDDNDVDSNSNDIEDLENVCGDKFDKITEQEDEEIFTDDEDEEVVPNVPDVAAAAKDSEKMETDNATTVLKNEISDSLETVIITPPTPKKQPHRVVCSFEGTIGKPTRPPNRQVWEVEGALGRANRQIWDAEGTVTVDKAAVQLELEEQMKKMQKPGPKCMTSPLKPTITNIQNVKVVIRAHEIVDINDKLKEKCSNIGELNSRENEEKIAEKETEVLDAVANIPETSESAEVSAEVIKNVEEEAKMEGAKPETDVMIVDDTPSVDTCTEATLPKKTADSPENKILSPQKNVDAAIKSADIPESQESIVIIDEIIKDTKPKNLVSSESKSDEECLAIKRIAPTKLLSSSPKISKTSTPIKSMPPVTSAQIDKLISNDEVIDETRATGTSEKVLEVSAIKKNSKDETINNGNELSLGESLELEEKEAVDDVKAEIEVSIDEDEKKPLLKLRSFAKPPEHWTSPPQKYPEITIKKTIKKSRTIELVDLDDDDEKMNVITCQSKTSSKLVSSGNKKTPGIVRVTITLPSNKINKQKINLNEKSSILINTGTIASGTSSSSSSKQRGAGVIKIATVNPTTSNNRIVGQVRPMKNNNAVTISRIRKPVIVPYNRVKPNQAPAQNQSNHLSNIPISNAIAGLSSIQNSVKSIINNVNNDKQTENSKKKMCLNPVNRAVLTKVAQKVVNPVARINLSQKTVSSVEKSRPNAS